MVLEGYSVYVKNGKIEAIGRFEDLVFSKEAEIIDAEGKYLLPGFSDMHVHVSDSEERILYLANGITLIRNMWGTPEHLAAYKKFEEEKTPHPELYTTGPLIDGKRSIWPGSLIIEDPDEVAEAISKMKADGYNAIKVYDKLTLSVYNEIIEEADRVDLPVVGHVPGAIGIRKVIESGQLSIEHLTGYSLSSANSSIDPDIIELTIESGIWNCPTLVVYYKYANLAEIKSEPNDQLKYVPPGIVEGYWRSADQVSVPIESYRKILKILFDNGARIVAGTDAGNPYVIAGFSLHEEFQYMNSVGLTPYQVLLTTTKNAAEMLGYEKRLGTTEAGKDADLVLLDKNPLEDIANTSSIAGVMTKGVWLPKEQLQRMLDDLALGYSSTK